MAKASGSKEEAKVEKTPRMPELKRYSHGSADVSKALGLPREALERLDALILKVIDDTPNISGIVEKVEDRIYKCPDLLRPILASLLGRVAYYVSKDSDDSPEIRVVSLSGDDMPDALKDLLGTKGTEKIKEKLSKLTSSILEKDEEEGD